MVGIQIKRTKRLQMGTAKKIKKKKKKKNSDFDEIICMLLPGTTDILPF